MRGGHARGAGQPHERGADGLRDPLVQLVGNDAADVVRLEDLRVLPHFGFLLPMSPGHGPRAARRWPARCVDNEPTGPPTPARDRFAGRLAAAYGSADGPGSALFRGRADHPQVATPADLDPLADRFSTG